LGEIWIDGGVDYQAVLDHGFGIETNTCIGSLAGKKGVAEIAIIERVKTARGDVGNDLHVVAGMNAFESLQRSHVLKRRIRFAGLVSREVGVLVGAGRGAV